MLNYAPTTIVKDGGHRPWRFTDLSAVLFLKNEEHHLINRKLRIGIVVGEVSGDTLGVKLMRRFRAQGIEVEFEGVGGPQMIAEGFQSHYSMDQFSVMGIVEVLKDLKKFYAIRDGLIERWTKQPIDIFIGIDSPDFNLRMSKSIKQQHLPTKTVQYVSPSVWAWRQGRVHGIRASVDLVLCLFPFEKGFYHKFKVNAAFVGHPLASELPLDNPLAPAKIALGLDPETHYIALLPGSRKGEVERLGPLVLDAAQILIQKHPTQKFVIPAINALRKQQIQDLLKNYPASLVENIILMDNAHPESSIGRQVMNAADIVALASGTATLEAMFIHRPMVTFYKLNWLTYTIAKFLVKIPYYALPNIIAGKKIVQELIQQQATPERLAAEIERLFNIEVAGIQVMQFRNMHKQMSASTGDDPVTAILELLDVKVEEANPSN
ncbi:lipid-A-disaccharide synthase [Acinetobacter calcoaceticus]|uniref:Lipid-A-disaccharide synthase n=1 Tax=Acinetobacter calcoaceticus TaxID=471 RepID=A0A4R1XJS1_ACICA|nr:lipid-A-disaccharide synthase [Acinetobacter calcoaceticus]